VVLWLLVVLVGGMVSFAAGFLVTDHLEQDNDFCNACHLEPGLPLHIDVRRDFDAETARSLAGVHGLARVEGREDAAFRCIDCHGGHSPLGRVRVKLLAGLDTFWYVTGRFEEPDGMAWPLWDEDCRKCHERFDEAAPAAWESPRFHQLAVHNVELGVDCVECHQAHEAGGNPQGFFLEPGHVRSRCAVCHPEYADY
jgi:nitrate/TMAO reductase-like tetraheme cytochrome c subunit